MLATPLSASERLLLIALGYEMAAADGEVDARETMYLRAIAHRLDVHIRHITALDTRLFPTVELGLSPIAKNLLAALPTLPSTMDT